MIAVILFGLAALGGVYLASLRLRERELPLPIALVHGGVAAAGLVALLVSVVGGSAPTGALAPAALGLFVVAALGGFGLFSFHLRKKPLPIPLMIVHALVAVSAYGCLLFAVFGQAGGAGPATP
jgi:hypothetical protein